MRIASLGRAKHPNVLALAVPQVILLGGMLVMLVVHPNAVRSGLMSTRAILVNAGLLAGWLLLSFVVLPRVLRNDYLRAAALTVVAVAAVFVLVVPTLHDNRVVEAFPKPESVRLPDPAAPSTSPGTPVPPSTTVTQPVRVSNGELRGIDHDASGSASVYRLPDGSLVVGLEHIDVEPGPDYHVYVARGLDRKDKDDAIYLAELRGNQGTQYYDVPRDVGDVGEGWTVLLWCRAFGVPIANATQEAL
jgi:Electron transfer DM13